MITSWNYDEVVNLNPWNEVAYPMKKRKWNYSKKSKMHVLNRRLQETYFAVTEPEIGSRADVESDADIEVIVTTSVGLIDTLYSLFRW